ncbi:MAG: 1-deoxy-D-xylulose-5-phosphate reductoisomerase [Acidimicrobiales bacterium]
MTAGTGEHAAGPFATSARKVALIGSTGSIGTQAVDVIRDDRDRFDVVALGARDSVEALAAQAHELRPEVVALADPGRASELARLLPKGTEVVTGAEGLVAIAGGQGGADVVLNAVVGFAGLGVTLSALGAGRRLALANKESLIAGGAVVAKVRETPGAEIVPVDSEHCALHQCLRAGSRSEVARLVLTASGGPFRGLGASDLEDVRVEDALAHPTWRMGPKVTVDSSTLMNKGLEVIEAHELFGIPYDRISVVVHPQSIVHSMVVFSDGSTIAQMADPDMRMPIGYSLGYPERSQHPYGALDWQRVRRLDFELPDRSVFRCLELAESAGRQGGLAPAWLNAGNEVAVAAFLEGRIAWSAIADVVSETVQAFDGSPATDAQSVIDADARARRVAERAVSAVRAA